MSTLRLTAATPAEWFATHLDRFQRGSEDEAGEESERRWYDAARARSDDGAMRTQHTRYVDDGATPQAAAKWVVGEHLGRLATVLAYTYVGAGAAITDAATVRFGTHRDGWVQLVELGQPRVTVVDGHPWSGLPGVDTVADATALAALVVGSVRRFGDPYVVAGRRLARVGAVSLWAEVADALATWVAHDGESLPDPAVLDELRTLLEVPGAPWRQRPDLWRAEHHGDPVVLARKGGCCLAYQCEPEDASAESTEPAELDPWTAAWKAAFPPVDGEPSYCSTCCFRDLDDCATRLLWQRDYERTTSPSVAAAGASAPVE